jgi:hypothetical protein
MQSLRGAVRKGEIMKKKDKKTILKQYGIDIPDEVLTGAERATEEYNQLKLKEENRILKMEVESLQKKVEKLKKYEVLWGKIKESYIYDNDGDANVEYKETVTHNFYSIKEYVEYMEGRFLREDIDEEE